MFHTLVLSQQGIFEENKRLLASHVPSVQLLSERTSSGEKVRCTGCDGFFREKYYYKHKCPLTLSVTNVAENVKPASQSSQYILTTMRRDILKTMKNDHILDIIKSDDVIIYIGNAILAMAKPKKGRPSRKKARQAMRSLGKLKKITQVKDVADLFLAGKINKLVAAINELTENDGKPRLNER